MHNNRVPPWSLFGGLPQKWKRICIRLFVFGVILNILIYAIAYIFMGGSAANGKIENGRYYVGERSATYFEVSKAGYYYNLIHLIGGPIVAATSIVTILVIESKYGAKV